ncbi:MAG: RNA polymerase sigma factor [Bacteroidota bacterium]|nr:RNA polymerase sigma factor [Bacteroidota bacterium]
MAQDEISLIKIAQQGDAKAFEELVNRYDRNVLTIALKYFNNEDDAKDVYQEVFIRVFNSIKGFKFQSSFSTWLYRITVNVCITMATKAGRHEFVPVTKKFDDQENEEEILTSNELSPDGFALNNEKGIAINNALEKLPPKQRICFVLKYFEGYKIIEIAEMLKCKDGTVKKYLFDAQNKMRYLLKDYAVEAAK